MCAESLPSSLPDFVPPFLTSSIVFWALMPCSPSNLTSSHFSSHSWLALMNSAPAGDKDPRVIKWLQLSGPGLFDPFRRSSHFSSHSWLALMNSAPPFCAKHGCCYAGNAREQTRRWLLVVLFLLLASTNAHRSRRRNSDDIDSMRECDNVDRLANSSSPRMTPVSSARHHAPLEDQVEAGGQTKIGVDSMPDAINGLFFGPVIRS